MTTGIMTFNKFIAGVAGTKLMDCVWHSSRKNCEELKRYVEEGDYQVHLEYVIDTWKNLIDEHFVKIDYDRQGTFEELYNYFVEAVEAPFPNFNNEWLDDIFERHILVTNVLK